MRGVLLLALSLPLAGGAAASDFRLKALGGVEGMVDDEATELNLAIAGNPAGLAWLPRGVRLDYAVARDESQQEHDSVIGRTRRGDTAWRLGAPGGPYQALSWIGARNAWQLGVDGGADFTLTSLQPVGQKDTQSATTFFGVEARFTAGYARRMTERLALGVWLRPLGGFLGVPAPEGVERSVSFALSDVGAGAAVSFPPARWGEGAVGLSFTPFNDRLDLRDAIALAVGASDALTDVGAYEVTQTLSFQDGSTQTWKTTPAGTTLALQGVWSADGRRWEAGATLDGTTARATQSNRTGQVLPGGVQLVQEGLASEFSRTRFRLAGRHRQDLAAGRRLRYGLMLLSARSTGSKLDFPNSEAVTETRTAAPLEASGGVAFQAAGGSTAGVGLTSVRERQTAKDVGGTLGARATTHVARALRLGWEYRFTPRWTGRTGVVWSSERSTSDDPSAPAPGSDPSNPVRSDRALSAGAAFRSGWKPAREASWWKKALAGITPDDLECAVVSHALAQSPDPTQGQALHRSRLETLFSFRWLF